MSTIHGTKKWLLPLALCMVLIGLLGPRLHHGYTAWRTLPPAQFHQYLSGHSPFFIGFGIGAAVALTVAIVSWAVTKRRQPPPDPTPTTESAA